jgi:hypothetical protein
LVRAKNSSGWGNWSQTRSFLISIKPNKPTLITPSMDEIVKKKSVVFSWNNSYPEVTSYELQLLLSGVVVFKDTALTDTALVFVDTKPDSRYTWYVRAKNQAGWSEWSGIRSFGTIQLPSKVELIEPGYNANLKTDTVLFTWEKPAGDISNYSIEIYSSGILIKADSNLTDTCFKASLIRKHEYKWRVLAGNDFGNGPWSIERPFFLSEKEHKLTVQNGEGSGNYNTGDKIKINAIVPDSSMEFLYWSGDTDFVENKALQVTYVTIPNRDLVVSANFTEKIKYELIIQNGTGSGKYYSGTRVKIEADPPQSNYKFIVWTGNTECLDDSSAATTYATIPSINIVLTAKYELMSSISEFNQLFDSSISLNLTSDYIEIVLDNHTIKGVVSDVRIFDILGIEQSTPNLTPVLSKGEGVLRLDVSSLSPGVYFVRIGDVVRKFLKM